MYETIVFIIAAVIMIFLESYTLKKKNLMREMKVAIGVGIFYFVLGIASAIYFNFWR